MGDAITYETTFEFMIDGDVKASLETLIETGTQLLPRVLSRRIMLKELRERFTMEVDRHCGRMRFDFFGRVEKSAGDFIKRMSQAIDATVICITNALQQSYALRQGSYEKIFEFENNLKKKLELFNRISQDFNTVKNQLSIQKVADKDPR